MLVLAASVPPVSPQARHRKYDRGMQASSWWLGGAAAGLTKGCARGSEQQPALPLHRSWSPSLFQFSFLSTQGMSSHPRDVHAGDGGVGSEQPSVQGFPSSLKRGQGICDMEEDSKKSSVLTRAPQFHQWQCLKCPHCTPRLCAGYCSTHTGGKQSGQREGSCEQERGRKESGKLLAQLPSPAAMGWVRPSVSALPIQPGLSPCQGRPKTQYLPSSLLSSV